MLPFSLAVCLLVLQPLPVANGFVVPSVSRSCVHGLNDRDIFVSRKASVEDVTEDPTSPQSPSSSVTSATTTTSKSDAIAAALLETLQSEASQTSAKAWVEMMFGSEDDDANAALAGFYALFEGIRTTPEVTLGLRGTPFVLKKRDLQAALGGISFDGFFSWDDLQTTVQDPYTFLEAGRGTTDNRKGWKMAMVANNGGQTYDETRLTWTQITTALTQGTVVLNSAGAHVSKLAGPCLACLDATGLPNALNAYVTAPNMRTSAPPHTDKQDVIVVQTSCSKHWRVYSPPDPARNIMADVFARGKGDDNLPLHQLETLGCELLLDTVLNEGDVLFIPAGFPHTTDTVNHDNEYNSDDTSSATATSIHLTFGLDTRIWDLDYLGLRRWALRRANIRKDAKLGQLDVTDNKNIGPINLLPAETLRDLHEALPMGFLELDVNEQNAVEQAQQVCQELERISTKVDPDLTASMGQAVLEETTARLQEYGHQVLNIHRDMYLAAIQEGRTRDLERAMTAHLDNGDKPVSTSNLELERLSIVRVRSFFDKFESLGNELIEWAFSGSTGVAGSATSDNALPADWAFTLPLSVGDQVEADLGGAWFSATVKAVRGNLYDVVFFDGDADTGLERSMLKLLKPPAPDTDDEIDTSGMTAKQLKRWKKEQAKKK